MIVVCSQRTMAGAAQRAALRGRALIAELPAPKVQPKPIERWQPPELRQRVDPVVKLVTPRDHFNRIIDLVARMHGSNFKAVMGSTRKPKHAHARQAAMCALMEAYPDITIPHLSRVLGDFDHSTVYHAMRRRGYVERKATWKCGHPRTAENTQKVGSGQVRCRTCRLETGRQSRAKNPRDQRQGSRNP